MIVSGTQHEYFLYFRDFLYNPSYINLVFISLPYPPPPILFLFFTLSFFFFFLSLILISTCFYSQVTENTFYFVIMTQSNQNINTVRIRTQSLLQYTLHILYRTLRTWNVVSITVKLHWKLKYWWLIGLEPSLKVVGNCEIERVSKYLEKSQRENYRVFILRGGI